jgi:hypothetical protein
MVATMSLSYIPVYSVWIPKNSSFYYIGFILLFNPSGKKQDILPLLLHQLHHDPDYL